jgi:uncharacterized GH25 family protein
VTYGQRAVQAISDEEGRFTLTRLAQGYFSINVRAEGYQTLHTEPHQHPISGLNRIQIHPEIKGNELLVKLKPGLVATVLAVDAEKHPVAGAKVIIVFPNFFPHDTAGNTDSNGVISFNNLPEKRMLAFARKAGFGEAFSEQFNPGTADESPVIEVMMPPAGSISGQVKDSTGNPIAECRLEAGFSDLMNQISMFSHLQSRPQEVYTDKNGYYIFSNLGVGNYQIHLKGPQKISQIWQTKKQTEIVSLQAGEERIGVDFVLDKAEGFEDEISGRVIDENDMPVKDAQVDLWGNMGGMGMMGGYGMGMMGGMGPEEDRIFTFPTGNAGSSGKTDANGEFHLTGLNLPETIKVVVSAKGYLHQEQEFNKDDFIEVRLEKSPTLSGKVIARDTGEVISGAELELIAGGSPYIVYSGEQGQFLFENVMPGEYELRGSAEGFAITSGPKINFTREDKNKQTVLELDRASVFAGKLVNTDGVPVPGARIRLNSVLLQQMRSSSYNYLPYNKDLKGSALATSDTEGMFRLEQISPLGDMVLIEHDDYAVEVLNITPEMLGELVNTIVMKSGGSVYGKVYDKDGKPVGEGEVNAVDLSMSTFFKGAINALGEYEIANLPEGYYTFSSQHHTKHVYIADGERTEVDLGGMDGTRIYGTVFHNNIPVPDAEVRAMTLSNSHGNAVQTDANGFYEIKSLQPGQYMIIAHIKESEPGEIPKFDIARLDITEQMQEVQQDLFISDKTVTGTVRDAGTGEPIPEASVIVKINAPILGNSARHLNTDQSGKFAFPAFDIAEMLISIHKEGYQHRQLILSTEELEQKEHLELDILLESSEKSLRVYVFHNGQPVTNNASFVFLLNGQQSNYSISRADATEGYYLIKELPNEPFQLMASVIGENQQVLKGVSQTIIPPEGEIGTVIINTIKTINCWIILEPDDHAFHTGPCEIFFPATPVLNVRGTLNSLFIESNKTPHYCNLPEGHHPVHLKVPGYKEVRFFVDELIEPMVIKGEYRITLKLERERL